MKDYFGYEGKVCVVTGAASGMGKATAELLVELGAKVYALDWAEINIDGLAKAVHVDLSKKESIEEAFKQVPEHVDCYFGIAGVSGATTDFVTTTKIDLLSNKHICEEILNHRMSKGGAIAFITSTGGNGWENPDNKQYYLPVVNAKSWEDAVALLESSILSHLPGSLGYSFSKLAMNYYTAKLQATFAAEGIRVNSVLPGSTDTGLTSDFVKMAGGEEALLSHTGYAKRLATSQEMAEPIVFLNSEMASYISGELLAVDFGCTAEERAEIAPPAMPMTFAQIVTTMQQRSQQM